MGGALVVRYMCSGRSVVYTVSWRCINQVLLHVVKYLKYPEVVATSQLQRVSRSCCSLHSHDEVRQYVDAIHEVEE